VLTRYGEVAKKNLAIAKLNGNIIKPFIFDVKPPASQSAFSVMES